MTYTPLVTSHMRDRFITPLSSTALPLYCLSIWQKRDKSPIKLVLWAPSANVRKGEGGSGISPRKWLGGVGSARAVLMEGGGGPSPEKWLEGKNCSSVLMGEGAEEVRTRGNGCRGKAAHAVLWASSFYFIRHHYK